MQAPLHPMIAHLPIVLTVIMPALVLAFALMIKKEKMTPSGWWIILGLQIVIVISGYVALETGDIEEDLVKRFVSKDLIHQHELAAETFVGASVLALVLSIASQFVKSEISHKVRYGVAVISLVAAGLGFNTGRLGGELVYVHGAAEAHVGQESVQGILPTPGMNTSESPFPVQENESLKVDENDYGNSDEEVIESPNEDVRQED